ncbi:MAG: RHS repeat-associated core domain-containing protein, partial [Abditibacteriaceae bacterium]
SVVVPDQTKSTFEYDSDGLKRISTEYTWDATANNGAGGWTQSDETKYIYDGMNLVQEQAANGTVKASYVRDGNIGGVLSMTNADGTFDYHYDGNGNVVALTDSNQNIVAQYSYDAYGNLLSSSGSEADKNPFRFSSKYYDSDTGLYDYGFRHYDSSLGRWINRDPSGVNGGLNLYGFVSDNPVSGIDPNGLAEWITIGRAGIGPVKPFYLHAYIRLSKVYPELGSARTFGFYPPSSITFGIDKSSNGTKYHSMSYISSPDPGQNTGSVEARNNDPLFEKILVEEILKSYENTPNYLPWSVCGSWVGNVWERAKERTRSEEWKISHPNQKYAKH